MAQVSPGSESNSGAVAVRIGSSSSSSESSSRSCTVACGGTPCSGLSFGFTGTGLSFSICFSASCIFSPFVLSTLDLGEAVCCEVEFWAAWWVRAMESAVSVRGPGPSSWEVATSTSLMLAALLWGAVAMPPLDGSPSVSRLDFHCLYLVSGKRSLTSSMVISFFSLLRRWGRGMLAMSISVLAAVWAARRRL